MIRYVFSRGKKTHKITDLSFEQNGNEKFNFRENENENENYRNHIFNQPVD